MNNLLRTAALFTLPLLLVLNAVGDTPSPLEQAAKLHGVTVEQMQATLQRGQGLEREYEAALKSSEGAGRFQATLTRAAANIDGAAKPITLNGRNLPDSFTTIFFPKAPKKDSSDPGAEFSVLKSGFMGLKVENFYDQFTLRYVSFLINNDPDLLLPMVKARASTSLPTAADFILYKCILIGLNENNYALAGASGGVFPPQVPLSRSAGLLELAQAQDPIYRLLAVQVAEKVESDATKRLNFYSTCHNETDPYILRSVIYGISRIKTPAAVSVLKSFEPAVQKTGDTKLTADFKRVSEQMTQP